MDNLEPMIDHFEKLVPTDPETYPGEDGRLYCSRCHTPRQSRVVLPWNNKERLVNCVCDCMRAAFEEEEELRKRMDRFSQVAPVRIAGFPAEEVQKYTFANDDGARPQLSTAMQAYVRNFTQLRKDGKGLLLYGDVGTGKTFAGGCIVNALEEQGYPCLMTSFSRLEKVLFDMRDGKRAFLDKLLLFDLVLFDDLGVERDTEYMTQQVTDILDSFYRAGIPMIITSNYTPKQLTGAEDIRKKRVYDRLLERCHPILVDGESRRKQQGRHDYAGMKQLLGL